MQWVSDRQERPRRGTLSLYAGLSCHSSRVPALEELEALGEKHHGKTLEHEEMGKGGGGLRGLEGTEESFLKMTALETGLKDGE